MEVTEEIPLVTVATEHMNHAVNNIPTNHQSVSPYISCKIEGEEVQLLVDTGATVNVLTKEIVDLIIKRNPKVAVFSICGVRISNAVGKQICKATKQILCECQIGTETIYAGFIQVENLNEKGILGADLLHQYHAQVNFDDKTIQWNMNKNKYICNSIGNHNTEKGYQIRTNKKYRNYRRTRQQHTITTTRRKSIYKSHSKI